MQKRYFQNEPYMTQAVASALPAHVLNAIWQEVHTMNIDNVDPLQRFELSAGDGEQIIRHIQKSPYYEKEISIKSDAPITDVVYIADDGSRSTVMFSDEY